MSTVDLDNFELIKGVPTDEAECTIVMSRMDDMASIYVSDNSALAKILKKWRAAPDEYHLIDTFRDKEGNVTGYTIETAKTNISFRAGRMKYSEESRRRASESMKEKIARGVAGKRKKASEE